MEYKRNDTTIYYEVFGEGRPIIMLHGWSIDHHHMVNSMEPLFDQQEGWQRIYVDLPGHGKSAGPDWVIDQDKMLQVVLDFIDHAVRGRRFVVAGASAGAYLARGVVSRKAAQMDGLLLIVPLIVADDSLRTVPPHVTLVEEPGLTSELNAAETEAFQLAVVQSQKLLERLRADPALTMGGGDPDFQDRIRQDPQRYGFSFDADALPEPFAAPTLILTGRQDAVVGYRDAWNVLENYPRGTYVVLDRAGHLLEIEQEGLFQALVSEWLDRVQEFNR